MQTSCGAMNYHDDDHHRHHHHAKFEGSHSGVSEASSSSSPEFWEEANMANVNTKNYS
jgi:hypothetical protein